MEVSSAEQDPGVGAAGAGTGPAPSAPEEIDLSLDDIIKRNKNGQTQPNRNRWRWQQQLRSRNPAYGDGRSRFRSWVPQNVQGSSWFRGGFQKPRWTRKPFWSRMSGPGPRAAGQMQGRSPLNRAPFAQQGKPQQGPPGGSNAEATADPHPGAPARGRRFKTPLAVPSNRPFRVSQRPASFQRLSFKGQQIKSGVKGKPLRIRRWPTQPDSGAVLTVSVSNHQASQPVGPGAKRPFWRGRSIPAQRFRRRPKGVPLRFNFRAMANQTSLTLNERFSGLRLQRRPFAARRGSGRMVTLP